MPTPPPPIPTGDPAPNRAVTDELASPPRVAQRRALRLLRVAAAVALLAYLYSIVDVGQVAGVLRGVHGGWLAAAAALSLLMQWTITLRLKQLTDAQGAVLPMAAMLEINFTTLFYGLFLPGGNVGSWAVRFYKLSRQGGTMAGAAVALVLDRLLATMSLCAVGVAFWFLADPPEATRARAMLALLLVVWALLVLLCVALSRRWNVPKMAKLAAAVARWKNMSPAQHAAVSAVSVLSHLLGIGVFVALALAASLQLPLADLGYIRAIVILATMVPLSVAGLGLREGAMMFLLSGYGVAHEQALAMALLVFLVVNVLPGAIGGAMELWRWVR